MEQNSSKGEISRKTVYYAGSGLVIGAAIGMIFGPMLFENLAQVRFVFDRTQAGVVVLDDVCFRD